MVSVAAALCSSRGLVDGRAKVLGVRERQLVERLAGCKVPAALQAQRAAPQRRDVAVVEHCK